MNDAKKCRGKGWVPGDILEGDEGYGPTQILLTAIGKQSILAIEVSHNGKSVSGAMEDTWSLDYRDWRKVGHQEL